MPRRVRPSLTPRPARGPTPAADTAGHTEGPLLNGVGAMLRTVLTSDEPILLCHSDDVTQAR
ncbi:hypothetical protein SSP24_69210 [Streptomyces spinoverrucosus]|uniref:Uncharacterized protein n=1 Tax=Streptomyces spinoverrucosus TaxID=284043 RepID=A0A4Y3VW91_9ACTN|nr:hypothetical protein SSP24_69210 [Streptomyces spinoverrucosus]GHB52477.1 hypothetical protein GCM10010397_22980 [Streptomyces spinoverrucosus]